MNGRAWSEEDRRQLAALYPALPTKEIAKRLNRPISSVYGQARKLGVAKSAEYLRRECRLQKGSTIGRASQFHKGHVPANKGLRRPGYHAGRMKETQFKKGQVSKTWVPVGTEVLDDEGYLKRKISDDRTKPSRFNWRYVHTMTWEAKHGPLPRGHAVAFKNGDRADIREENLELVSRRELMRRNSVHNLPKALAEVVQLRGALIRQIRRKERARA
jgi:hypothetical protein